MNDANISTMFNAFCRENIDLFREKLIRRITFMVLRPKEFPKYFTFWSKNNYQGRNSVDIYFRPRIRPSRTCPKSFWSFETCLNLQCSSTEVVPELVPVWHPVLPPKFKMSIKSRPFRRT